MIETEARISLTVRGAKAEDLDKVLWAGQKYAKELRAAGYEVEFRFSADEYTIEKEAE